MYPLSRRGRGLGVRVHEAGRQEHGPITRNWQYSRGPGDGHVLLDGEAVEYTACTTAIRRSMRFRLTFSIRRRESGPRSASSASGIPPERSSPNGLNAHSTLLGVSPSRHETSRKPLSVSAALRAERTLDVAEGWSVRPRHGVVRRRDAGGQDLVKGQQAAGAQRAARLAVETGLVGHVHAHVLHPDHVERSVLEGHAEAVPDEEGDGLVQPDTLSEHAARPRRSSRLCRCR